MYAVKQSEVANRRAAGEKLLDPITATMAFQLSGDDCNVRYELKRKFVNVPGSWVAARMVSSSLLNWIHSASFSTSYAAKPTATGVAKMLSFARTTSIHVMTRVLEPGTCSARRAHFLMSNSLCKKKRVPENWFVNSVVLDMGLHAPSWEKIWTTSGMWLVLKYCGTRSKKCNNTLNDSWK